MIGKILVIDSATANQFLINKHYSGRKPQITLAFGWYVEDILKAVVTYGKPASPALCKGVCGEEHSKHVYELNRLCRLDDFDQPLSQFVAATLRRVSCKNWIVVSYADCGMNHNGYIYQACNFLYTGKTKERLQFHVPNGHSRHGSGKSNLREVRTSKHRYVYFATKNKKLKKDWIQQLNYKPLDYPKEKNEKYVLGTIFKPTVVKFNNVAL